MSFSLFFALERLRGLMDLAQSPSSHPYPRSVQLKLYHAFIFSVPILFTIILFLLFHLFYVKRRRTPAPSSPPPGLSPSTTVLSLPANAVSKQELREKLPVTNFNKEESGTRETQCCVCLVDFQMKELLHQVPSCKHLFHIDCIHAWLMANASCPLCRSPVLPLKKDLLASPNANHPADTSFGSSGSQVNLSVQTSLANSGQSVAMQGPSSGHSHSTEIHSSDSSNFSSSMKSMNM